MGKFCSLNRDRNEQCSKDLGGIVAGTLLTERPSLSQINNSLGSCLLFVFGNGRGKFPWAGEHVGIPGTCQLGKSRENLNQSLLTW